MKDYTNMMETMGAQSQSSGGGGGGLGVAAAGMTALAALGVAFGVGRATAPQGVTLQDIQKAKCEGNPPAFNKGSVAGMDK